VSHNNGRYRILWDVSENWTVFIGVCHMLRKLSFLARYWCSHLPFYNLALNDFLATFLSRDESYVVFSLLTTFTPSCQLCSENDPMLWCCSYKLTRQHNICV
jgi:hypothetical protein